MWGFGCLEITVSSESLSSHLPQLDYSRSMKFNLPGKCVAAFGGNEEEDSQGYFGVAGASSKRPGLPFLQESLGQ